MCRDRLGSNRYRNTHLTTNFHHCTSSATPQDIMSDSKPHHTNMLARVMKLTSTKEGLDASLMMAQYSSPLVIAFLLSLARFRASHPHLAFSLRGKGGVAGDGGQSLVRMSEGIAKAAGSIGDARVIMRAFGESVVGYRTSPKCTDCEHDAEEGV